jgi:hypothetical protein
LELRALKRNRRKPELHDDVRRAIVAETEKVKGLHPEPYCGEGAHNGTPKRLTMLIGVTTIGTEKLVFCLENPSNSSSYLGHPLTLS